jgi:hypothetical protein
MLNFELFIRLRRHFNLVSDSIINLWLGLNSASDNLISKDSFIYNSIEGPWCLKVLIVSITSFGRVDSDEISSLLILLASFSYEISMP